VCGLAAGLLLLPGAGPRGSLQLEHLRAEVLIEKALDADHDAKAAQLGV